MLVEKLSISRSWDTFLCKYLRIDLCHAMKNQRTKILVMQSVYQMCFIGQCGKVVYLLFVVQF